MFMEERFCLSLTYNCRMPPS